jgi:prepilin signal peptidase PulO-like enzyme (type II secretory pathway)
MGWGDVKLAGLVGLMTGFPTVFVALLLAVVSGGFIGGILLLLSIKKRKDAIPFGPYICLSAAIALIWGNEILAWYLHLFA